MILRSLLLLMTLAVVAIGADVEQTVRDSYGAFLQGRYEDAGSGWRYLASLGVATPRPEANEALSDRDAGRPDSAMPLWIKASVLDTADGFLWNQRGWSFLALNRIRDAKESFGKAIDRSSSTATQAEANLGLGLAALLDAKPKAALEPLKRAGVSGPFAVAASARLSAEAYFANGDYPSSLSYLRQAMEVDPFDRDAVRALVRLLDRIGDNRGAWLAARRALAFDTNDAEARRVLKRNRPYIQGDPDAAAGVRRISRPMLSASLEEPPLPATNRPIRVGLYGAPDGRPAVLTRCYIMANSSFRVTSVGDATMRDNGQGFDQWEIEFRSESNVVEVRDAARNLLFVSKQPFSFIPASPRGSILVKSAKFIDDVGVDLGDREHRGILEVIPNPWGFRLVAETPLELYLNGVVSLALPNGSTPDALKAQAVVSRTAALWTVGHRPESPERFDVLDDRSLQSTIGVSGEMRSAGEAVLATEGIVLSEGGLVSRAPQHEDSGGITEDGKTSTEPGMESFTSVNDSPAPLPPWSTPLDFERFIHELPTGGLYSEAAPGRASALVRWVRILDMKDIRTRIEATQKIGRIRAIRIAGRTKTGRIKTLQLVGSAGTLSATGFSEIQKLLSPGSLRSTLFTLQPLYDGKYISKIIVWGAGTGLGYGFARSGAIGQGARGSGWKEILAHYFPNQQIRDVNHALPLPGAPATSTHGVGPYRRTLNYRLHKPTEATTQKK